MLTMNRRSFLASLAAALAAPAAWAGIKKAGTVHDPSKPARTGRMRHGIVYPAGPAIDWSRIPHIQTKPQPTHWLDRPHGAAKNLRAVDAETGRMRGAQRGRVHVNSLGEVYGWTPRDLKTLRPRQWGWWDTRDYS